MKLLYKQLLMRNGIEMESKCFRNGMTMLVILMTE